MIDISMLYFISTVALLVALVVLLIGWVRMTRILKRGDEGYELSLLSRQLVGLLVASQVALSLMALTFWLWPEVLPRGAVGLTIQITYAVIVGYVAVRIWRLADSKGR